MHLVLWCMLLGAASALRVLPLSTARRSRCRAITAALDPLESNATRTLEMLERCLVVANLEERAEAAEADNDLVAAIEAYEGLLELQPPTSPYLCEQDAARRALQQLLLESAKRELAECGTKGCEVPEDVKVPSDAAASFIKGELQRAQDLGEETRSQLAMRALDDVCKIRNTVVRLLQLSEDRALEDAENARAEQSYLRLVEGQPAWIAGWQLGEATRRRNDARLLRKSVEADLNRLELQLLQGDPSLAFIRTVVKSTRPLPDMSECLWLEEQFDIGALPRDPELLRTLLAQARKDPELVMRLVTQAKDSSGKDIFTRKQNDRRLFEQF